MTVFDCLTLSAVGNDDRMLPGYETSLLLFANARGAGTLLTANALAPGLIVKQMPGICPGAMLAVGIDSHITLEASKKKCYTNT